MYAYSWTFPLPPMRASMLLAPTPFQHMYFMDDPMGQLFETMCETAAWDNIWTLCIKGENLKYGHVILEPKMAQLCQR